MRQTLSLERLEIDFIVSVYTIKYFVRIWCPKYTIVKLKNTDTTTSQNRKNKRTALFLQEQMKMNFHSSFLLNSSYISYMGKYTWYKGPLRGPRASEASHYILTKIRKNSDPQRKYFRYLSIDFIFSFWFFLLQKMFLSSFSHRFYFVTHILYCLTKGGSLFKTSIALFCSFVMLQLINCMNY
jgi:hypothetical protein